MNTDTSTSITARRYVSADQTAILADIYQEDVNVSIWQRQLSPSLQAAVDAFLTANPSCQLDKIVTPENAFVSISKLLGRGDYVAELSINMAELVEIFCDLFELEQAGFRLATLNRAMCPRFHTDKVPCRLITTYQGVATEWLPDEVVDYSKLGTGNGGLPDEQSGLFQSKDEIRYLNRGDVALFKGERWIGNEQSGLVHRSPAVLAGEQRLLLTLDFVN